jgi:PHP family Zn ribbon phosphoesterase
MSVIGTRWYKCDFHIHTSASECFVDDNKSIGDLIDYAIEKKIECLAITDHNSPEMINDAIEYSKDKEITVFPGVELTCDTSKIHVLVLFDIDKNRDDVFSFLSKCNINHQIYGKSNATTTKSLFDVIKIVEECNALIIPAHVDDYNGLDSMGHQNLIELINNESVLGFQLVQKDFHGKETLSDEEFERIAQDKNVSKEQIQ